MNQSEKERTLGFLRLLLSHRGESTSAYNQIGSSYDVFASAWDSLFAKPALSKLEEIVQRRANSNAIILDAGCGTGRRTQMLLDKAVSPMRIFSLDASVSMINAASQKIDDKRVSFMTGDINKLPFDDSTFDFAISTFVIDILDRPKEAIEELIRVIKPDGFVAYVFCSLPEGPIGEVINAVVRSIGSSTPLSHMIPKSDRPFHDCSFSELHHFRGGLLTTAVVGKCCSVTDDFLPCKLPP